MRIRLLGVRAGSGSSSGAGSGAADGGGLTSCIAVDDDAGVVRLVLDAGTGLAGIADELGVREPPPILVSHAHRGHVAGLRRWCDADGAHRLDVRVPAGTVLPHDLDRMPTTPLRVGDHGIGPFEVRVRAVPHGRRLTYGFRVSDAMGAFAYVPDHEPQQLGRGPHGWGAYHPDAVDLVYGVDVLLHGTMADAARDVPVPAGHTVAQYAAGLAQRCHVPCVALVHHAPAFDERDLDALAERLAAERGLRVLVGRAGDVLVPGELGRFDGR
ncbi:MAG: hypothetical protein KDB40_00935 [Acidimicrobiales bacterium]|nr:hypothetical protein [Acidimicrobiales bacterium]MCB9395059.1 hypothetical protein [Acidimicrobiaceae bacterium]